MWIQSRYALEFFTRNNIPFHDMVNANSRVTNNNWCLIEKSLGKIILVYIKRGGNGTATMNLWGLGTDSVLRGNFDMSVHWYDPRNGGELQVGSVLSVTVGSAEQAIGYAPNNNQEDWVVLLQCLNGC
jgi:Putative collagen-binding domain of a collagenase